MDEDKKTKHIIRVLNTDLDGHKPIGMAMTKIKGVSRMFSNMVLNMAGIKKSHSAGLLTEAQVAQIEDIISNPDKYDVPDWMLNRRIDLFDGKAKHLTSGNLNYAVENDIRLLMKMKSNRGLRHSWGLPVRGQRTKSNFRKNKGKAVGVKKKAGAKSGRV